jgi:hypothetical protein
MVLSGAALEAQNLANALQALSASYAASNPAVAGRLDNARDKAQDAVSELTEVPPDNDQAVHKLEEVVDRIMDAVNESPGLLLAQANPQMDAAAGIAHQLASEALAAAILRLGDPLAIASAQTSLSSGDTARLLGIYQQAISHYRNALQAAAGA